MLRTKDGTAGYFDPLTKYLKDSNHEDIVKEKLRIHDVVDARSPSNPNAIRLDPPKGLNDYQPRYKNLLSFVSEEKAYMNTAKAREQIARQIMKLNNHDNMQQSGYGKRYAPGPQSILEYGGDLTPSDLQQAAPLSDFLTIRDTMDIVCSLHSNPETQEASSPEDILANEEILLRFFRAGLVDEIKKIYCSKAGDPTAGIADDLQFDPDPFGDN